jgi:quercetin dioxygenase-like cupin family protein
MAYRSSSHHLVAAGLSVCVVALFAAGAAGAAAPTGSAAVKQAPPPTVVELLSRGTVPHGFDAESAAVELEADHRIDVAVARVTYPTGSTSGWHSHPGPTVVTITKGTFSFKTDNCSKQRLRPGDTFVEPGPSMVARLNNWTGKSGEIVVTFFAPVGADPLTIPMPAPACTR